MLAGPSHHRGEVTGFSLEPRFVHISSEGISGRLHASWGQLWLLLEPPSRRCQPVPLESVRIDGPFFCDRGSRDTACQLFTASVRTAVLLYLPQQLTTLELAVVLVGVDVALSRLGGVGVWVWQDFE
jgi:hypothetical protein